VTPRSRASGLLWIARAALRANRRGALLDVAAACVGAAALVFFLALGVGVSAAAQRMFPADARLVEVLPGSVALGGVLGGGTLDDDAVARLAALPGAAGAWPRVSLRVPLAAPGPPKGLDYNWPTGMTLQIPVVGLAPELVAADVREGLRFEDPGGSDRPIPVLLSRRLVEIYNKTIAPAWGVRRLPAGLSIVGLELPVKVGYSIVPQKTEDRVYETRLKLVGLSDRVPLYMVAVPLETVRRLHAEYGKPDQGYTQATVLARRAADVPALTAAIRRMGLSVDEGERATAERVGTVVLVTTGALVFLAAVMCGLAALAIAQSLSASVRARTKEIAVLEALGAAPSDVRRIVLAEGAIVGVAGGVAGAALAFAAALAADRAARALLPDFPFRPETFFSFPPWLVALGVLVPLAAAVLGALAPAAAAARVDPARTLS
jgi:ABC-type antimicrobial peptide transport system permease subunit